MREFKDIFKNLRLDKDMTQDELADALRITKQAVSHYERGTRYPKPDMLDAISDYFNVDMDYLTGRSSRTTRPSPPLSGRCSGCMPPGPV